jgi:hypothetical protein
MRVFLDVNVLISAVISPRGNPARILALWRQDRFDLAVSEPILEELERVLHYPRIRERYHPPEKEIQQFLKLIATTAIMVEPSQNLSVIERDPSDDRFLECAVEADARYIVTGDSHLLELKDYRGIMILNPTSFLALLGLEGTGTHRGGASERSGRG